MCICYAFVLHCLSRTTGEDSDIHQQLKVEQFNCSLFSSIFSRRDNLKRHIYIYIIRMEKIKAFAKKKQMLVSLVIFAMVNLAGRII